MGLRQLLLRHPRKGVSPKTSGKRQGGKKNDDEKGEKKKRGKKKSVGRAKKFRNGGLLPRAAEDRAARSETTSKSNKLSHAETMDAMNRRDNRNGDISEREVREVLQTMEDV